MMRKQIRSYLWLIPILALAFSCSPEFDATTEELDLAITRVNDDQDFTAYQTFYLEDTVVYIGDEEDLEDIDRTHDEQIISEVRQHMLDMGWQEITDPEKIESDADVTILLSALAVDVYFYYTYWWDYWDWWYWGGWHPGYPWYPSWPGYGYPSYGYSVGTVIADMVDVKNIELPENPDENPRFDIIWTGAVNGLLIGSDANISSRLSTQLDQVFAQSPYLIKN